MTAKRTTAGKAGHEYSRPGNVNKDTSPGASLRALRDITNPATKLAAACQIESDKLKHYRQNRFALLQEYVGDYFGATTNTTRKPINLFHSFLRTLMASLCPRHFEGEIRPQLGLDDDDGNEHSIFAAKFEAVANQFANERAKLAEAIRAATFDAAFGLGIVRTGLGPSNLSVDLGDGNRGDPGAPFSGAVDLDDFFIEVVRKWEEASFMGNKYRIPFGQLMDSSSLFDAKGRGRIEAHRSDMAARPQPDSAASLSSESGFPAGSDYGELIELADIYVPAANSIKTVFGDFGAVDCFLREVDWPKELPGGPYDPIRFYPISSNLVPLPPLLIVKDLGRVTNRVATKLENQAVRQKELLIVRPSDAKGGDAIRRGRDGEVVVGDIKGSGTIKTGGVSKESVDALRLYMELFNHMAGNPDLLGGLAESSDRVSTNQQLQGNADICNDDMRGAVNEAAASAFKKIAYFVWTDPHHSGAVTITGKSGHRYSLDGDDGWRPFGDDSARVGEFSDYRFGLSAYPAASRNPAAMYRALKDWWLTFVQPAVQMLAAQGTNVDLAKIAVEAAKHAGIGGMESAFAAKPAQVAQQAPEQPQMPGPVSQPAGARGSPGGGLSRAFEQVQGAQPTPMPAQPQEAAG